MEYMRRKYGAVCIRSAGSHSPCDLLCGNGQRVFAVQVKGGGRRPPKISWEGLKETASKLRAEPVLLWKSDYGKFVEVRPCGEEG